jgi:dienelactone hydrolase
MFLTALAFLGSINSGRAAAQSNQVPAEDTRNTEIIGINTHMPLPSFSSVPAWEARKAFLRRQLLVSAGHSPMPEKTPLHPQVFGKIEGRGYTIEKVLIETLPGFYLGGNLYRPLDGRTRHPGVLNPHGHWERGRLENEPVDSGPALGISLARQGYVVFAYDMVGYTDTIQIPHRFGSSRQRLWSFGPLGLQLWDSIRAMDFIASLDDVDQNNIGMTGASGGGTQTFLLAAIDERVKFASPVNMVSAIMQGGDLCENAPGLRLHTSNVEIAAMFAPKPMLLVSDTTDWTRNVPREEYPAIKKIYELYGKGDQVSVVQFEAEHNFNQQSREAVYKFFAQVNPGLSDGRELTEHDIEVPKLEEMRSLSGHTLPSNAVDLNGLFHEWRAMAEAQNARTQETQSLRTRMLQTLAIELPDNVISQIEGEEIMLSLPGFRGRLKGISIKGTGALAIVIDPEGAAAAMETDTAKRLKKEGRAVLAFDLFQTGPAKAPRDRDEKDSVVPADGADATDIERKANHATGGPDFLTFNVTDDEARVQDIVSVIAYAEHLGREVEIYARGDAAIWATFAAAVSRSHVTLHLENMPNLASDDDYLIHFNVPGILRAGGLPAAERLANSR